MKGRGGLRRGAQYGNDRGDRGANNNRETLAAIAGRGQAEALRVAEAGQSPARRGRVLISIWFDPIDASHVRHTIDYERPLEYRQSMNIPVAASDVPLWAAILIGLGSGLIGTVARISYERTAELRTRMIEAADEFSTTVFHALAALRNTVTALFDTEEPVSSGVGRGPLFKEPLESALKVSRDCIDEVHERLSRVHLLIGVSADSLAGERAETILLLLRRCQESLGDWPKSLTDGPTLRRYNTDFEKAVREHDAFNRAARREIRAGVLATLWRWSRRAWAMRPARGQARRKETDQEIQSPPSE